LLITDISKMKKIVKNLKKEGKSIGFVPTMGYLHQGHISLIRCSKKENEITVVSIFLNPLQFGKNEDLGRYPRDIQRDVEICTGEGVDYIFYPDVRQIYPEGYSTYVIVEGLTEGLCGAFRPGHFKGVTTIVNKLFNIIQPDRAYFGKKDYQQYLVIKKMVNDLNMDVQVIGCPVVREDDGLAMSSRNKYLSTEERKSALSLSIALFTAKRMFEGGETDPEKIKQKMRQIIQSHPHIRDIQYIEIVDPETLQPKKKVEKGDVIALAVYVGDTRLIDNITL